MIMKVAVPTKGSVVDKRIGYCRTYTLFTTNDNNEIISTELLHTPPESDDSAGVLTTLKEREVNVMLAGNMGENAQIILNSHGISVYQGNSGNVREATEQFLTKKR
jgi:predicted Fe-Mo cluster-binding NifX family protein